MTTSYARLRRSIWKRGLPPSRNLNTADRITLVICTLSLLYLVGHVVWSVIR